MAFQLQSASLRRRLHLAQSKGLDFSKCTTNKVQELVESYANAVGCPREYIFLPLLTTSASFMGASTSLKINDSWSEPPILWTLVVARKGEKKSAALKPLLQAVEAIEEEERKAWQESQPAEDSDTPGRERRRSNAPPSVPPQRLVEQFSFEQLHSVMVSSDGTALGLYDEMSTMYEQLDVYKHAGSRQDRFTLLKLYNGSSWARSFRSVSGRVPHTAFNMSGFIQPSLLLELLHKPDVDGFNDRQLFDCPAEIDPLYDDLVPLVTTTSLKVVLENIRDAHKGRENIVYHFSEDAMKAFTSFHDDIVVRRAQIPNDENRRGVLSKAKGQVARNSLVLHTLEQAVHLCTSGSEDQEWSFVIEEETVLHAVELVNHFIQQKFSLMPEDHFGETSEDITGLTTTQSSFVHDNAVYIRKLLLHKHDTITPSIVSQLRLMPPTCNKTPGRTPGKTRYPVSEARSFLNSVADLGFGSVHIERCERMTTKGPVASKSSFRMVKRKVSELEPHSIAILKRLKITDGEYSVSYTPQSPSSQHQPDEGPLYDITNTSS